jgi:hypothetical protein
LPRGAGVVGVSWRGLVVAIQVRPPVETAFDDAVQFVGIFVPALAAVGVIPTPPTVKGHTNPQGATLAMAAIRIGYFDASLKALKMVGRRIPPSPGSLSNPLTIVPYKASLYLVLRKKTAPKSERGRFLLFL